MDLYKDLSEAMGDIDWALQLIELTATRTKNEKAKYYMKESLPHLRKGLGWLSDAEFEMTTSSDDDPADDPSAEFEVDLIDDDDEDDDWDDDDEEHIVTIEVPSREAIEAAVAALPPDKKKKYDEIQAEFERLTAEENPDHEVIAAAIKAGNDLIGL